MWKTEKRFRTVISIDSVINVLVCVCVLLCAGDLEPVFYLKNVSLCRVSSNLNNSVPGPFALFATYKRSHFVKRVKMYTLISLYYIHTDRVYVVFSWICGI